MKTSLQGSTIQERPKIINSTSFYLSNKTHEVKAGRSLAEVINEVSKEGSRALFIPSSEFTNPKELLDAYYSLHLSSVPLDQARRLVEAYLAELNKARNDDRYFTRNPDELDKKYKEPVEALRDIAGFLERHGFRIKIPRELSWDLLNRFDIEKRVVHQSEKDYYLPAETKG